MQKISKLIVCQRRKSCRYFCTCREDLYSILGLRRDADQVHVKAAFRKKAKALHPDADTRPPTEHTEGHFRRVLIAYQVLRNPETRRAYDLQSDEAKPDFLRQAARQRGASGPTEAPDWNVFQWEWVRNINVESDKPVHQQNNLERMRTNLQAEWREALLHAYLGPSVDMSTRTLPSFFEADERSHPSEPDILQVVSGRQQLATVREGSLPLVTDARTQRPLQSSRSSGRLVDGRNAISTFHSPDSHEQGSEAASMPSNNVGTASVSAAGVSSPSDSTERSVGDDSSSQLAVRRLELIWEDGEVGAVLTQHLQPDSSGNIHLDVHCCGRHVWRERGDSCHTHHTLDAADDCRASEEEPSTADTTRAPGRPCTHQAVVSETPFVKHLDFIAMKGVGGLKCDRLVSRCKRAWLPPSSTWLFPPRCDTHTIGGWYIEVASSKHHSHPAWIRPEVLVLRAAVETLRAERLASREARTPGIWARFMSRLRAS